MTPEERKQLGKVLAATAFYYNRQITPEVVSMMLDDLDDMPFAEAMRAYQNYRQNPKNKFFPLPAQIREIICPQVDPDSAAREIAARITAAIPKFGWNNGQSARAYIGEVGWSVVERQGGWVHLCQHHGLSIDPTAFQAQVREQAKGSLIFAPEAMHAALGLNPPEPRRLLPPAQESLEPETLPPATPEERKRIMAELFRITDRIGSGGREMA